MEGVRVAWAQPFASAVTATIVGTGVAIILTTTGQTIQAERDVLKKIDDAGTRTIVIVDPQGTAGMRPEAIQRINALSTVEWVTGFGPTLDGQNSVLGGGGNRVAVRFVYGDLPPAIQAPQWTGENATAIVGRKAQSRRGLQHPSGGIRIGNQPDLSVVGTFTTTQPLEFLDDAILTPLDTSDQETTLRTIYVLARRPSDVEALAESVVQVLGSVDRTALAIETSSVLAEIRAAVRGELGSFGRELIALVLAVALILVSLNVYGTTITRRRDFGRRRALGASRPSIVAVVTAQTLLVAVLGTLIGSGVGSWLAYQSTADLPEVSFLVAVAFLAAMTATIASIPPALAAAFRDPVRILRVP